MKALFSLLAFLLVSQLVPAQSIPAFSGQTLDNQSVTIPENTNGRYALICFATGTRARQDLETWLEPVYNKFIAKTGLWDQFYDVAVFFIPVFRGANASMQETVKRKFNEGAQEDVRPHVLFVDGDLASVTAALNISDDDTPYFFLLNKEGKIIFRTTGAFTDEKLDEIDDLLE